VSSPSISPTITSNAIPVFYRISTTKNPADKTIQVQSDYPLIYVYQTEEGGPLGVSQAPTEVFSPLVATWTFPQIPYPTKINVQVMDAGSHQILSNDSLLLFGGDVFKVRLTYLSNNPASHGYIDAMVNGNRQTVFGQDYIQEEFYNEDVWTRGSQG
jgi:hypothetical protein